MRHIAVFHWAASILFFCLPAAAQGIDPHLVYEQNCAGCHAPHGGEFVAESVTVSNGELVGKGSQRPVSDLLASGHGKLSEPEIEALLQHFSAIQETGNLFMERCVFCHDRAVVFARRELIIRDGVLYGRYSKRNAEEFLPGHARLDGSQAEMMVDVLKRQLTAR